MSQENRVETMAQKLGVYAGRAGVAADKLVDAYFIAVQPRIQKFGDVFHPEILHPARTALILLQDTNIKDSAVLSEAIMTESEYAELRISRRVPTPLDGDDEWLMEELVSSPDDVVYVAMAERLDHARHLRFREESLWRPFYDQVQAVYLPVCRRTSPELAARFERWALSFERRQL